LLRTWHSPNFIVAPAWSNMFSRFSKSATIVRALGVENAGAARSTTANDAAGTLSLRHPLSRSVLGNCSSYIAHYCYQSYFVMRLSCVSTTVSEKTSHVGSSTNRGTPPLAIARKNLPRLCLLVSFLFRMRQGKPTRLCGAGGPFPRYAPLSSIITTLVTVPRPIKVSIGHGA